MSRKTIIVLLWLSVASFLTACNTKPSTHEFKFQRVTMRKFAIEPDVIRVKQGEDVVIVPSAFPQTIALLDARGFKVKAIDVSEFQKAEGGVTCKSIIFNDDYEFNRD